MAITELNKENFDLEVNKSEIPVLIDFFATWCGPCKMLSPVIDEVANEKLNVKTCKLDIDKEGEIARKFGIRSVPTLVLVKSGKVINSSVGLVSKNKIIDMINSAEK